MPGLEPVSPVTFSIQDTEKEHIFKELTLCNGKVGGKGGAAELLQIDRSTLVYRMKKHGLNPKVFKNTPAKN